MSADTLRAKAFAFLAQTLNVAPCIGGVRRGQAVKQRGLRRAAGVRIGEIFHQAGAEQRTLDMGNI